MEKRIFHFLKIKDSKRSVYKLFYSTRLQLIISFLGGSVLVGLISMLIGVQLLYNAVLHEATNRIRLDLNAAREIYLNQTKNISIAINITAMKTTFITAVKMGNTSQVFNWINRVSNYVQLDFAGIVMEDGKTLCRIGPNFVTQKNLVANPLANFVIKNKAPVSGTVILDKEFLIAENPDLANRSKIKLISTPMAEPQPKPEGEETSGMAIVSAVPIFDNNKLIAVLYGGILLNRSQTIVDRVRETIFQHEIYKGKSIGTVTIFLQDLRISTNVLTTAGKRAIGTRASKEVKDHVLINGKQWIDRAFVVSDWYITAYEPIIDIFGKKAGMLYVGVLEAKYNDIRQEALLVFVFITMVAMALAIGLGYSLANKIMRPVQQLIRASNQVSQGNLSPEIGHISNNEIGVLQKTFIKMLSSLQEHNRQQQAESENKLLQSEKQASIGRLAAGVAHEINNPLTGVLTFTHMLLRRKDLNEEVRSDLQTVARETERVRKIVKGLLDFSRQTKLEPELTDVNGLIRSVLTLVENQALIKGVGLNFRQGEGLPMYIMDRNQMKSAVLNIIINAIDATEPGGNITITTGLSMSIDKTGQKGIEMSVMDTGCGIPLENLDKLLDPFFTTKKVGEGTGLGLSVSSGIVERHGGIIRIQSDVGRGSIFTIWLPLKEHEKIEGKNK